MNTFSALIDTLLAATPDRRSAIEQVIRETFERPKAVLALDMSGFSLSVRREGILPYLCQIRRMQKLTLPIVLTFGGELVKFEADNLLAVFDDAAQATEAALAMIDAAAVESSATAPPLAFSIGIDYGNILLLDRIDCFGDAVNLAHKLGEDTALPGEVLITGEVVKYLSGKSRFHLHEMDLTISGLELVVYQITHAVA